MSTTTLLTRKDALGTTRIEHRDDAPLAANQIRVRIESFALTTNNITYAAFGDDMSYWGFFPSGEEGWGIVPVWGFGAVVQSAHPGVAVGERLYGYWPLADQAVLQPTRLRPDILVDGAAHRAALPPVYNGYFRCAADALYTPDSEDIQALLRPLFITSWLIDDFLADNDFFGADTVLLSSASSKTAYGTAFQLSQRPGIQAVGLTSAANKAFCESLGCYARVLTYDEVTQLAPDTAGVYVDFSGNAAVRRSIHTHLGGLRYSMAIGSTHVDARGSAKDLPGPRPVFFFAPSQIKKRHEDWGAAGFNERLLAAWRSITARAGGGDAPWLQVQRQRGAAAVQAVYQEVLAGRGDPRTGHILSLIEPPTR
ncbi:MAG: DUF2855 family protein [Proteobacteria bacterium]|nr:DUF2855 family protein [Pseudomonadota bacterium]